MFFVFLLLSVLFWFLSQLSKDYTHDVTFKTNYINFDNSKIVQNKPLKELNVSLQSSGFRLLSYQFNKPKLNINLSNLEKHNNGLYYYLTNRSLSKYQFDLQNNERIINIKTDTLFFDFGILKSKDVNVKPAYKITFKSGYNLTDKINVSPKKITITGPKNKIDSIKVITTNEIVFENMHKNFKKTYQIKTADKVKYSQEKILISAQVEKFTQGSLALDYKIINVPNGISVSSFTKKINISYNVSLNNFDKIFAKDFNLICDFLKAKNNNLTYLIPEFTKKSPLVSSVKINPSKIEFLIKK